MDNEEAAAVAARLADRIWCAVSPMVHGLISNYAVPGLNSYLVGGEGHGRVRLFTSTRHTEELITPHSHRFNFGCLVLNGTVYNTLYHRVPWAMPSANEYCMGTIEPLEGGLGSYVFKPGEGCRYFTSTEYEYKAGDTYAMESKEIHSIRFSKNARVLFFEGPEVSKISTVLEPWVDGKRVPTFKTEEWMFEKEAT